MMTTHAEHVACDGTLGFYGHASAEIGAEMRFAVFVPAQARAGTRPALYFLAGLSA